MCALLVDLPQFAPAQSVCDVMPPRAVQCSVALSLSLSLSLSLCDVDGWKGLTH